MGSERWLRRVRLTEMIPPAKLCPFLYLRNNPIAVLDVGCGNRSPSTTKHWFPNCSYYGLDKERYNNADEDYRCMTRFFEAELETSDLSAVPNSAFDLIMMAHVIEHLHNGEEVIAKLAHKLRPGGVLYIESPSERSLRLPSGVGCLNFRDDPTHVRLYTYREIAAACRQSGLQIAGHGTRRSPVWMLVDVLSFPLQVVSLLRHGKLFGPLIWDLVGFASFIIAKRPSGQAETT